MGPRLPTRVLLTAPYAEHQGQIRMALDHGRDPLIAGQAQRLWRRIARLEKDGGMIEAVEDGGIAGQISKGLDHLIGLETIWKPRREAIHVEPAFRDPRRPEPRLHRIFLDGAVVRLRDRGHRRPRERATRCDEGPNDLRQSAEEALLQVRSKLRRRLHARENRHRVHLYGGSRRSPPHAVPRSAG